ncbi:hypothetical protein LTR91_006364 [Friedmanniomyces endolithicus]|uniref:Uncharacterized protein n=1 Tax=Friedmanniomyces endolithicus TaxID=329885 RepID=A0AAN6JCG6_9PEZI|nr:hypothetical protein LTR35_002116 [Friedmanniomyces endolithicus]KAK0299840.1 hypothetical protein LTS00_001610 [Friedmanniomyces endolithicus]KAK0319319.1 hypothetical protein LTR82_009736 [Friedmanniomyces endolithicus]KAK0900386.1 hypothetical protein LTR57_020635 [Friedmanniomyces endolithicus]KAK0965740.1 hypothetical protein LTS01_018192 [Friedmanniomyces endolithicus]
MALTLTERDQKLLLLATQCFEGADFPKVDYVKLANIGGYKTKASATTAWCALKKRLLTAMASAGETEADGEGDGDAEKSPPATGKRAGGGKKRGAQTEKSKDEGEDGEKADPDGPSPKKRGRKAKTANVKTEEEKSAEPEVEGGEAGVEEPEAPKKRGRPAKNAKTVKAAAEADDGGAATDGDAQVEPEIKVVKKRGRPAKNAAAAKTVAATPEADEAAATDGEAQVAAEGAEPKKRGRGRPAKAGGKGATAAQQKVDVEMEEVVEDAENLSVAGTAEEDVEDGGEEGAEVMEGVQAEV